MDKNSRIDLRKCLDSIYKNTPVNRLIIVDAFSTDRTLEIIEYHFRDLVDEFFGVPLKSKKT